MTRRGQGVLEVPEPEYAPRKSGPRRAAGALRRDLQEDFGQDFKPDYGRQDYGRQDSGRQSYSRDRFDADGFDEDGERVAPVRRRGGVKVRLGFLRWLPRTLSGKIWAGVAALAVVGVCVGAVLGVRNALLHDERFVIPSSAAISIEGTRHVTKGQLLSIFGEDVERNIFTVPLAERRAELERLPWVEHATVMRLLPDHLRVSIVERTPVAFVRQGGHIGLVDKSGVLMDITPGASLVPGAGEHYSFPVVLGISADEPLSTRAARMKIYQRFTTELDSRGSRISDSLDEVDLSSPEDVKALIPDDGAAGGKGEVLVHFGESDFLERYDKYKAHLAEWRAQYPRLASVDMRYERQVVLEMQPVSAAPPGGDAAAVKADAAKAVAAKSGAAAAPVPTAQAAAPIASAAATSKAASTVVGKAGSPIVGAGSSPAPVAAKAAAASGPDAAHPLTVSPVAKAAPAAKKVSAKKVSAKARHPVKKKPVIKYHPPAVVKP